MATKDFAFRRKLLPEALEAAKQAVILSRTANHLDTLACVHALAGNFKEAARLELEAVELSGKPSFEEKLAKFAQETDCTGED